ncbi:ubiquitin-conjugating enzyme E2 [Ceratobasidium sp. AG-Ba]|nr:ubiquitin-conjugating enzyme E2 [Ceratobasidium sp. AG-Ba]QRW15159.1 ubiquitin-conjugating enzyme E2 [Ceratobasidium sp. AG-Ba]
MSHPGLSSFNPLAAHPFTAAGSIEGSPIQTPTPPEDSLLFSSMPRSMSSSPSVSPLEAPDRPAYAPQTIAPKPIPSYVPQGVFEQYDRGRVTPDLVIRKKLNNWGTQRVFR